MADWLGLGMPPGRAWAQEPAPKPFRRGGVGVPRGEAAALSRKSEMSHELPLWRSGVLAFYHFTKPLHVRFVAPFVLHLKLGA